MIAPIRQIRRRPPATKRDMGSARRALAAVLFNRAESTPPAVRRRALYLVGASLVALVVTAIAVLAILRLS